MNPRTLIVLAVVLIALGVAAWLQLSREEQQAPPGERMLIEGFDPARLTAVSLDQVTYSLQMRIERDEQGLWQITDPIRYPADPALMHWMLDALTQGRATEVAQADPAKLGFAPPRAVLTLIEESDGSKRERRLELGEVDVDREHVFVRVDGRFLRTTSNLDTLLDRPLVSWRDKQILPGLEPTRVTEIHRTGGISPAPDVAPTDLALDVRLTGAGWQATKPFRGLLDPTAVGTMLFACSSLSASGYVDETAGQPELVGLDHPIVHIELVDEAGASRSISLTKDPGSDSWLCTRGGAPYVWRVERMAALALVRTADELVDPQFERFPRPEIAAVRLISDGHEVLLARAGEAWSVSAGPVGGPLGEPVPADADVVGDLLGRIGRLRFVQRVRDASFAPRDPPAQILLTVGGAEHGGSFGVAHATPEGGDGLLFQRTDEQLVFLVEPAALELARTDVDALRSRQVVKLDESTLVRAHIAGHDRERLYVRNDRGRWSPDGVDQESRDFALMVDALIALRAERWLPASDAAPLEGTVRVEFAEFSGTLTSYAIGRLGERTVCEIQGRRCEVDPQLLPALDKLLAGR